MNLLKKLLNGVLKNSIMKQITCKSIVYPFPCWITEKELLESIYEDLKSKGIEQEQFEINHKDNDFGYEIIFKNRVTFYE